MTPGGQRSLFLHCLRFDVLEAGPDRSSSRLYGAALAASTLSALLAVHLLESDLSVAVPALLCLTGMVAFLGIVADFAFTWFDARDVGVLETVPVSSSRYFVARAKALGVTLLLKVLAWGLVPAGLLTHRFGLLEGGAYLLVLTGWLGLLAALATTLLMVVQRFVDPARLRDVLVWLQVGLFVTGTAGWLLLFRGDWGGGMAPLTAAALPSTWFAEAFAALSGRAAFGAGAGLALGAVGLSIVAAWRIAPRYLESLRAMQSVSSRRQTAPSHRLRSRFEQAFVRPEERGSFRLATVLLRRERTFRLQTYPLLAYPVLFLAFGRGQDDGGLFLTLFSHLGSLYLPLVAIFLRYSDTPQAGWVLRLHGSARPAALWAGARKGMVFCLVLPLAVLVTGLLVAEMGWADGLGHGLFAFGVMVWVGVVAPVPRDGLPFSDRFQGGVEAGDEVKRVYPLFMLVIALGVLQYAIGGAGAAPLLAPLGLLIAFLVLRRRTRDQGIPMAALSSSSVPASAPADPGEVRPFGTRLSAELRGLAALYLALALFGWCVGWMA